MRPLASGESAACSTCVSTRWGVIRGKSVAKSAKQTGKGVAKGAKEAGQGVKKAFKGN